MSTEGAAALFSAMLLLAIVPGSSDALVVMRAISAGMRSAVMMILGIMFADVVMMITAIVGLNALARFLDDYMLYLNFPAGAFLLWWGYGAIRSRHETLEAQTPSYTGSFAAGFMITLADPKALLFFFALFPAFLQLQTLSIGEIILIACVGATLVFSIKSTYAWLSIKGSRLFSTLGKQVALRSVTGVMLCSIGIYLILTPFMHYE